MLNPDELRLAYLNFFAKRRHVVLPSTSLVPENDPTTLFTGSGMQPLLPYLLGQPHPLGTRLANSQKCFRSQDIEDVGDNRHTTFFEMLGNWSLGDYSKQDQLGWFFEFLTSILNLDPRRLYATVYGGSAQFGIARDAETAQIWQALFRQKNITAQIVDDHSQDVWQGDSTGRIVYYDANWWSRAGAPKVMPAGEPGGPDSEVFYDFGLEGGDHAQSVWQDQACHPNCDCGRFLEIGNSVFMEYQKQADGSFIKLPKQNIDFGGGFERLLAASEDNPDVFATQLFLPIIKVLEQLSGVEYKPELVSADASSQNPMPTRAMRIIADHVKATVMLAADGVYPGNKDREYFARRLVRRAIRYAHQLGIKDHFIAKLVPVIGQIYHVAYPDVLQKQDQIAQILEREEKKFALALERGLEQIAKVSKLDEEIAFDLYQTHGFPFELSREIAKEKGVELNKIVFEQIRSKQRAESRQKSAGVFKGGLAEAGEQTTKYHTVTHLLHRALRQEFGESIQQMGSNITAERLRFDFAFDRTLTSAEKAKITQLINGWIGADLPVTRQNMSKEQALSQGALAFFNEKYPAEVSVFTIGTNPNKDWVSKELCGGPHVKRTGELKPVVIFKDKAVGVGVRRLYLREQS
ncbi:MAG: alanine--tRNA ligase [Patescibacteria group bacterium]